MTNNNNTTTTTTTATTDIAIAEKKALDVLNKSLTRSSLDDLIRAARRSALCVDVSGSMGDPVSGRYDDNGDSPRKIDKMRELVTDVQSTGSVPVIAFGARVEVVDSIPNPSGQTPLAQAIEFAHREGATHLVVFTDGQPDSADRAFAAALAFGHPIDTFYIGPGTDHGATFCKQLAKMTGGTCNLTDLGKPKELAATVRLMLGDGTN